MQVKKLVRLMKLRNVSRTRTRFKELHRRESATESDVKTTDKLNGFKQI